MSKIEPGTKSLYESLSRPSRTPQGERGIGSYETKEVESMDEETLLGFLTLSRH